MCRKMLILCVAALLILSLGSVASAESFESEKTGAISVTLTEQYEQTPIAGAELSLYYIATVSLDAEGNLRYLYTDVFADIGIALDDPELATKLDAYLFHHAGTTEGQRTDAEGRASWENLPLGLYFLRQTGSVEGYAPCTPFLVTVPMKQDGGFVYAVNASPKTEVAKLTSITIRKVWNTDASTEAADSVTVRLLRDGKVVETAVLNALNNWQVTYPYMPESDAYRVEEVDIPKGFTATYQQSGYVFTVTNTSTLIQTGQMIWPIPLLAVGGMLLIWLGVALLRKKGDANA